ncbi:hypothetical protein [Bacillus sp. B15-48]|uniref:hypothetical protein n=1 Tax=Bacillus sp. B15-48 TaxID=1548601 RepID=UPI00193F6DAC|nr:hypothetical protein [Bacillus sp. B15-48]MBM4762688.1 hypothetical protein [Bacillus sp. B15-48]
MSKLGQNLLDGYNRFADVIVGWEVEQINKMLVDMLQWTFINMDLWLPLSWFVMLYLFRPTKPFVIGTGILGILLFLRGL